MCVCVCVEIKSFLIFANNSKQNKTNPEHSFVGIGKSEKRVQNFSKKIQLGGGWSLSKFSIFKQDRIQQEMAFSEILTILFQTLHKIPNF